MSKRRLIISTISVADRFNSMNNPSENSPGVLNIDKSISVPISGAAEGGYITPAILEIELG